MEDSLEQPDQPPPTSITIHGDVDVAYDWLEEQVTSALSYLGIEQSNITVQVVNDAAMSELHMRHSGVEGTTDVLTFDNGSSQNLVNADIAICFDAAQRAASKRAHTLQEELLLYIVHGILHCLGFDDQDEESHTKMHAEENRILTAIGVGTIWSNGS